MTATIAASDAIVFGPCHSTTVALLGEVPDAQVIGLFVGGVCRHSALKVPGSYVMIDLNGAHRGEGALSSMAAVHAPGETHEWRYLNEAEIAEMVAGGLMRPSCGAGTVARQLLRAARDLPSDGKGGNETPTPKESAVPVSTSGPKADSATTPMPVRNPQHPGQEMLF